MALVDSVEEVSILVETWHLEKYISYFSELGFQKEKIVAFTRYKPA